MAKRYGSIDFRLVRDPVAAQAAYVYERSYERPAALVAACRVHGIIPADPYNRTVMALALWFAEGRQRHQKAWAQ